jgi:hypothetical protein
MSTNAIKSQGTTISSGSGATPEVYTAIGEIVNASGPSESRETIDTTDLSEDSRSHVAGLLDSGEVSVECNAYPSDTGQERVREDLRDGTYRSYQIKLTDDTTLTFTATPTAASPAFAVGEKVSFSFTLRIRGLVVEA